VICTLIVEQNTEFRKWRINMSYFNKKRFSMRQVVGLLTIVFLGIAVITYAAVNIPYTFSSGQTAKASEVNANFQALANAMPAVKTAGLADSANISSMYPNGTEVLSLPVTLPASGKVIVSASGSVCMFNHAAGSTDTVFLKISKTSGAFVGTGPFQHYRIDNAVPTYIDGKSCVPFNISDVFDEINAGLTTYYLNVSIDTQASMTGNVHQVVFSALYAPTGLQ
jgi:hypothetical protein